MSNWKQLLLGGACLTIMASASIAPAISAPATDHPRLWVRSVDVSRLQGWATISNPMYVQGLLPAANSALAHANNSWNWQTGQPNANWKDDGNINMVGDATEAYAQFFAFMSLVDPNAAMRPQWAMRAKTLLMWVINQAAQGHAAGVPFRDPNFMTGNRMNYWGEAWGLTVDWIYPTLSSAEKTTIRSVFMQWANDIFSVPNRSGAAPFMPSAMNDPRVLGFDTTQPAYVQQINQMRIRWAANNYFIGQMRTLALMALAFDPADDPVNGTGVGSSLRSYINDVLGWWLYQAWAVFEDANVVQQALGQPAGNRSLGIASGGLPVEGTLYGESQGYFAEALLGLFTAGYADTAANGPQAGFFSSPYWDKMLDGYFHTIAPKSHAVPGAAWMGQVYDEATWGDVLRTWVDSFYVAGVGPVALFDQINNNQSRLAKSRWIATNTLEGGAAQLYNRASNIWGNSTASQGIFYFMMFDPAASAAPDPRPSLPTHFAAPAIGATMARTDWSQNATWFTSRCSWASINHQSGDCGQFSLYRKGAWLTKEWSNYTNDWMGYTPLYHNTMSLQNAPAQISPSIWDMTLKYGGQWNNGGSNGDPTVWVSSNANWAYGLYDMTNLYNHSDWFTANKNANDVKLAGRSILWLNPDYVVIYDRADSVAANEFKRFNLVLQAPPQIAGNKATATANGQTLTVQTLMPGTATIKEQHFWTTSPGAEVNATAQLDTSYTRLVIEDPANPLSLRMLNVLQGTDAGVAADTALAIHSTAGAAYDGVVIQNTAAVFPTNLATPVTTTTYVVGSNVTRHLITGLTPGAGYNVTMTASGGQTTVTLTVGSTYVADVGGVIGIGFPASPTPTQGGYAPGFKGLNPGTPVQSGGGGSSGGGGTTTATCGTVVKNGSTYTGPCAPLALIADGVYFYDTGNQRSYQQTNGQWIIFNDGKTLTYSQTATGWQGPGAPEQPIANGAMYYDSVEKRNYQQVGNTWVLLLPGQTSASGGTGTPTPTPTASPSCGTVTPSGSNYIGYCAPLALIKDGVYFYDMNGQRTYQQVGGKWTLISNGTTQVYTQTATGWQGPGAPAQLIASGALYYDTVEKRNYQQMGGIWVLL